MSAYFFHCHDKMSCCRLPGAHEAEGETLEAAIGQLPPQWVPYEGYRENGNQLARLSNQELHDACKAAGKYSR